jgi:hypothetical protein
MGLMSTQKTDLESARAVRDESAADLCDAVREGELEVGGHELLDIGPADVLGLCDLNHTEDLAGSQLVSKEKKKKRLTWMDRKRARCLAAMSW